MLESIPIVTACDQGFLPGLRALLCSLQRTNPERVIYLLDCGISYDDRIDLSRRFRKLRVESVAVPADLPLPSVGSCATYARLFVGDVFSQYRRVLYLDADTIVMSSLAALDDTTLRSPNIVAACVEPYTPTFASHNGVADFRRLGFLGHEPYFNGGVLLIDIEKWNRESIKDSAISYLMRRDIRIALFDQEALNVALAGRWQPLDPKWNVSRYWTQESQRTAYPHILREARIVHFLSGEKPWSSAEKIHPWLLDRYREFALP
ncbi:MAG: glycosyltransferase family 8 protein [Rhizobiales bacterium]|nr:glycosyltransferase family 8 protein [Hyphomicrobiales bacterium]